MGVVILALGRSRRENVALGALALSFGAMFVSNNLAFEPGADALPVMWGSALLAVVAGLAALAVAWTTEGLPRAPVVVAGAVGAAWQLLVPMGPVYAAVNAARFPQPVAAAFFTNVASPLFVIALALLIGLLAAFALAPRRLAMGDPRRPPRRLLMYAFGLYLAYSMGANVVAYDLSGYVVLFPLVVALAVALLVAGAAPGGLPERDGALVILAAGLAGAISETWGGATTSGLGVGILRIVGVAVLAYSVFRYDLLGVPLPRIAEHRGSLAMASLASLFIVAQIAENYLSAEYGLLMGGVVAGALLFAANPIQRAMERTTAPVGPHRAPATVERREESERAYRVALRRFLVDGDISAEEEIALAHLADEAGVTVRRTIELRHEVERELGRRG
ncbi:MAG: hypothetical protein HY556_00790 [Euryarchaeota archaeon]|nr:hypothetical protein [Euryarchaeota archaeon]